VEQADGHDRYVPEFHADQFMTVGHEDRYEWVAANWDLAGRRVLDFGCGVGYGTKRLARAALEADGVDLSPTAIRYAQEHYAVSNARFIVADLTAPLPSELQQGSYDLVCSSEVLEHVSDTFAFLFNMASLVTRDGVAVIGTPNRDWSYETFKRLQSDCHWMEFTPRTLANLLLLYFGEVQLYFHVFHPALEDLAQRMDQKILVGLRRAASAFAHEVLTTTQYERLTRRFRRAAPVQPSSRVQTEFVPADHLSFSPRGAMGLVAVCTKPTGFKPSLLE
jgi:2-polyprenyl-3-methyl-5-hydroxy-6-metoxy-1,4-benzoquinol methylase